jgi:DNA/RNA-binding domain of Phe-tRNA-synthetase-like protein
MLTVDPHPSLAHAAFVTELPAPLVELPSPEWLQALLVLDADAPVARSEELRGAVRDMLRHGGYKPTGRGKPASEYLVRAAGEGQLSSINLVVDACNVTSLASGIPISVVDIERAREPFKLAIAPQDTRYVFNSAGQEIDVSGLLCLWDQGGPTANAVKDAMRTKTHDGTRRTLSVLWGVRGFEEQLAAASAWYRELLERAGATTSPV